MLRCLDKEILKKFNDDGLSSFTTEEQKKVEENVEKCYNFTRSNYELDNETPKLYREKHLSYLKRGLVMPLPSGFQNLDASRAWVVYWITHGLALLEDNETLNLNCHKIIDVLRRCSDDGNGGGGYGGNMFQIPHLATSYAAVNAIVTLQNEVALQSIDINALKEFLYKMKQKDGSFHMHEGGETDVRGAYCAASIASLTNILTNDLFENTCEWIVSCQTYEGGFSGAPGGEAHGGYTFCAIAALVLLGGAHKCNLKSLLRWVVNKQQQFEGGFAGRTNKLVDGCYSFWQGAILPIIHIILVKQKPHIMPLNKWLFNQQALQEYLLCCCQETGGGLIDKPKKPRDFYHTCYGLSGLSIAQNSLAEEFIVGDKELNRLVQLHPLYNLTADSVRFAIEYFSTK